MRAPAARRAALGPCVLPRPAIACLGALALTCQLGCAGGDSGVGAEVQADGRAGIRTDAPAEYRPEVAGTDAAWVDPDATAELLAELETEGVSLAPEDLRRLGLPGSASPPEASVARLPRSEARLAVWHEGGTARMPVTLVDAAWSRNSLRARFRGGGSRDRSWAGYLSLRSVGTEVALGALGMSHGLGLLARVPGHRGVLTAGGNLLPSDGGLRVTGVRGDDGVRIGGGFGAWAGPGTIAVLIGRPAVVATDRGTPSGWTRLGWRRQGLALSLLGGAEAALRGGSAAMVLTAGSLRSAGEAAAWRLHPDAPWQRAAALATRWSGARLRVDAQAALARADGAAPLGGRPAALPGWDGWGWAVSGRLRTSPAAGLSMLAAGGQWYALRADGPVRRTRDRVEIGFWWRPAPYWRLEGRRAWRVQLAHSRDESTPWQPPQRTAERDESSWLLRGRRERGPWRARLDFREVRRATTMPAAVRRLVAASLRWREAGGWRLDAFASAAWGDEVDIVTAVALVPDRVLPLHWSRWRECWGLAVGRTSSGASVHGAVLIRIPEGIEGSAEVRLQMRLERRW